MSKIQQRQAIEQQMITFLASGRKISHSKTRKTTLSKPKELVEFVNIAALPVGLRTLFLPKN